MCPHCSPNFLECRQRERHRYFSGDFHFLDCHSNLNHLLHCWSRLVEKNPALCEREGVEVCLGCISGFANCNVTGLGQLGLSSAERRAAEFSNSNRFRCHCVVQISGAEC